MAISEGLVRYKTPSGNEIDVTQSVSTIMVPEGFEDFMYFTNEELPTGPPNEDLNNGTINFGAGDKLEGKVHTNGTFNFSNYGCPEIDPNAEITITYDAVENGDGGIGSWGACGDASVFEFTNEDGETYSILDTISRIDWPPLTSASNAKSHASNIITADSKITFSPSKKDTLIMSEIHFADNGYYLTQWWYLIPPVGGPPNEFDYHWDATTNGINNFDVDAGHVRLGWGNVFLDGAGYGDPEVLVISPTTGVGDDVFSLLSGWASGDQIQIQNASGTKTMIVEISGSFPFSGNIVCPIVSFNYDNLDEGFLQDEAVALKNLNVSVGLDPDIEFNAYHNFHSHAEGDYCRVDGLQHFDLEYWRQGDIFSLGGADAVYNSDYVVFPKTFFPNADKPQVLYVKGGQVLVRGEVKGKYTIVTDDYTEYRRHDDPSVIDRVWGNIWLIDDIVYEDSGENGEILTPDDGGTNNVLGMIAGGNVIIANTKPNGARGKMFGQDIIINGAFMAIHGGFLSHYWQNTTAAYGAPNESDPYNSLGDEQGRYRNPYRTESSGPWAASNDDIRGTVYVWGAIVQSKRGYMKRNQVGPYNVSPGIGYDKDYHYDYNLRDNPPPHYPSQEDGNGNVILRLSSYGMAR